MVTKFFSLRAWDHHDSNSGPTQMGCTCTKVQNEEGISRCRSRKRTIKRALKCRNQYAVAHSEYTLALMNMAVAIRQFMDGEFRDQLHLSSSSSTSSSTSTPMPRTPTTPTPPSSLEEEIVNVSRVKLRPLALRSNPPAAVTVVQSPPKTPRGSARTREDEDEYRRYLEADAPPDGLYDSIRQPGGRSPPYPSSSSYGYSSYASSPPYTSGASSSQYPSMPSTQSSWDIFGIFTMPVDLYGGMRIIPDDEDEYENEKNYKEKESEPDLDKVREEEEMPALETDSPGRPHEDDSDEDDPDDREHERLDEEVVQEQEQHKPVEKMKAQVERDTPGERESHQERGVERESHLERGVERESHLERGVERESHQERGVEREPHQEELLKKGKQKYVTEEKEEEEVPLMSAKDMASTSRADEKIEILQQPVKMAVPSYKPEFKASGARKDREVWEVLADIEQQFRLASKMCLDVSRMLEARRAHANSDSGGFSKRSAKIIRAVSRTSQRSSPRTPLSWNVSEDSSSDDVSMGRDDGHGSLLDRLYAWEKKLYTEVKDNDSINVQLERKYKQLKRLETKQAADPQIDKTAVAIKLLETQMQVSMHAMGVTSETIQKVTDEELYPQLVELLDGTALMWKNMALCHDKQNKVVARMKQGGRSPLEATSNAHRQATLQLRDALNNWHGSLDGLTNKHREYMKNLSSWLRLSTFTPDSRVDSDPVILKLCNCWLSVLEGQWNSEVLAAIKHFSLAIQVIAKLQEEEGRLQKRAESSAKELSKRSQAVHSLERKLAATPEQDQEAAKASLAEKKAALEVFKTRVQDDKESFNRAMQMTRKTTLETLESGLGPLFFSVAEFANRCSERYQELQQRLRNGE